LAIRRREIWDVGGICGLLRGHLFEKRIGKLLLRQRIEGCKIPLAVTSCNILRLCTEVHTCKSAFSCSGTPEHTFHYLRIHET
jgi:hypothetical protein